MQSHLLDKYKKSRSELWAKFCEEQRLEAIDVPLFAPGHADLVNGVAVSPHGNDGRLMLQRSQAMECMALCEVGKVLDDYKEEREDYDGLLYMMFRKELGHIVPLYIGKSEKYGNPPKDNPNARPRLSANIKGMTRRGHSFFCRWGYSYAYHMGDLSAWVLPGHAPKRKSPKYKAWANALFQEYPTRTPQLKHEIYFWMKAWSSNNVGIWREFGPMSLAFLEYTLIGVAGALYPEELLNIEGIARGWSRPTPR